MSTHLNTLLHIWLTIFSLSCYAILLSSSYMILQFLMFPINITKVISIPVCIPDVNI